MKRGLLFELIFVLVIISFVSAWECIDSDGGKNYHVRGAYNTEFAEPDHCSTGTDLIEYYCVNATKTGVEHYACPEGCDWDNGVCYQDCSETCESLGYECGSPTVCGKVTNCGTCNTNYLCKAGIFICISKLCTDSDGGKDYYNQGTTYGQFGYLQISNDLVFSGYSTNKDYCTSTGKLSEWFCVDNIKSYFEEINCPNDCADGKCVEEVGECVDSTNEIDYYTKNYINIPEGILWDECLNENTLIEKYCENSVNKSKYYSCSFRCSNGACLYDNKTQNQTPSTSSSSSSGGSSGESSSSGPSGGNILSITNSTTLQINSELKVNKEYYDIIHGNEYSSSISERKFKVQIQESKVIGELVEAFSESVLEESEGVIYATHSGGEIGEIKKIEIKISPDDAVESAKTEVEIGEIKEIKIEEFEDKIVYTVDSEKQAKIIALIKTQAKIKTRIDVNNGEIVNIKKPWWSFLATGI